jgi:hypothetical protein
MSDRENELKKALAENGAFDDEKAESEASRARRWFDSRLRRSARFAWMRIIIVAVFFEFAFVNFYNAVGIRAMIGYAAMMVISIGAASAIGVQSWVANTLLSLLREIKLLRLECLGPQTEQPAAASARSLPKNFSRQLDVSLRERIAWILAMILIACASGFITLRLSDYVWPWEMAHFEGAPVTVEAPRAGAPVSYTMYLSMGQGQCKVSQVAPDGKETDLFWMGEGFVSHTTLTPSYSLRLDPQGNEGEYWVRFQ